MKIYCIGSPSLENDRLPVLLAPLLRERFEKHEFIITDVNEGLMDEESRITVIDTVVNLNASRIFTSLDEFRQTVSVSMHDYDLFMHLTLLAKRSTLRSTTIIGVPPDISPAQALDEVSILIRSISARESGSHSSNTDQRPE